MTDAKVIPFPRQPKAPEAKNESQEPKWVLVFYEDPPPPKANWRARVLAALFLLLQLVLFCGLMTGKR